MSSLFSVGRLCVKLAGRDAGRKCVILSDMKDGRVLVDGNTRRREVSLGHLEPLPQTFELSAGADHAAVSKVFEEAGLKVWNTKAKKTTTTRATKQKVVKGKGKKAKAPAKKAAAKAAPKTSAKKASAPKVAAKKTDAKAEVKVAKADADSLVEKKE